MTDFPQLQQVHQSHPPTDEDLTGRNSMVRNVLASWAGYLVFIIAGFIVPRLIDRQIGSMALGVWDFGWAVVHYIAMGQLGVVSSVNRYVAKYRAMGNTRAVTIAVSSVCCVLLILSVVVMALTVAATLAVPSLLGNKLQDLTTDAKWVLFLLGTSLAVQFAFSAFAGVLSGCHRWGLKTAILSGARGVTVVGMICVLRAGGGLRGLAVATLCGEIVSGVALYLAAHRVCFGLKVRFSNARWSQAISMLRFGSKNFALNASRLLLNQTASILIVVYLGPVALAVFSRPSSLVRHALNLIVKLSHVLTPTASSLQAMGMQREIQKLLIRATRYAVFVALPIVLTLTILGDAILRFWMGPSYARGSLVLAVLAIGTFMLMVGRPARNILSGMNAHGGLAIASICATAVAIPGVFVALGPLKLGMVGAALPVAMSLTFVYGVYLPISACRCLKLSIKRYVIESLIEPIFCTIPYAICLLVIRWLLGGQPSLALLWAVMAAMCTLAPLYWHKAMPVSFKQGVIEWLVVKLYGRLRAAVRP